MSIKIKYVGKEKYSAGSTDISEPWNSTPRRDAYTYEIFDEKYKDITTSFSVIDDYGDNKHLEHLSLFKKAIDMLLELQNKIEMYETLSEEDKIIMEKFKQIYK